MTRTPRHSEAAFETVIEQHLLANGYVSVAREGFDREQAIFPETVLEFIRETVKLHFPRAATERTIVPLKKRRAALIAVAVNGQIGVRGELA